MKLLSVVGRNTKLMKSDKAGLGYISTIMYLAPHTLSGTNLCPKASKGCATACLFTSGFAGIYPKINKQRMKRTQLYLKNRDKFKTQLFAEIAQFVRYCEKKGQTPAIRLNGTSDIVWERVMPEIFTTFPTVQFYDYTKIVRRLEKKLPVNYHLTFSRSETNDKECEKALSLGFNIAVVFDVLPKKYLNTKVINGDNDDLRFMEGGGYIVGLKAKGRARKETSGFVIRSK